MWPQYAKDGLHLPYYLDEIHASLQSPDLQAAAAGPTTCTAMVKPSQLPQEGPQPVGAT